MVVMDADREVIARDLLELGSVLDENPKYANEKIMSALMAGGWTYDSSWRAVCGRVAALVRPDYDVLAIHSRFRTFLDRGPATEAERRLYEGVMRCIEEFWRETKFGTWTKGEEL